MEGFMTFRQIDNNVLKEYFKTRSIIDVAKITEIPEDLIQGILFTRGVVDVNGLDLGLNKVEPTNDVFGYEGPEAVSIRIELDLRELFLNDKKILEKYGKAKDGRIYRDIIIPPKFTLHQLNYVIQQSFGWKNCHMHNFKMKDEDFQKITNGKFKDWCNLCGIYFRFPDVNKEDLCWDDNYEEGMDFKEYLASKYIGPYEYRALGDYYLENQFKVKSFNENNKNIPFSNSQFSGEYVENQESGKNLEKKEITTIIPLESTLKKLQAAEIVFEGSFETLIESLEVIKVLVPKGRNVPNYELFKDEMIDGVIKINKHSLNSDMKNFGETRNNLFKVINDRVKIEKAISEGQFDVVTSWNERMDSASEEYQKLVDDSQLPVMPVTDEIRYEYDFGDGWDVKITSLESFYDDSNYSKDALGKYETSKIIIHDGNGNEIPEELAKKVVKVIKYQKPICIESSGTKLLDDVGGPVGFINMLRELNEPSSKEEFENMKTWAYELMDWSSKTIDPKNLL
jgi:hypothetical protein